MNIIPLVIAVAVVLLYIGAMKILGPPPPAQAPTLNILIGLIVLALVIAACWPLFMLARP